MGYAFTSTALGAMFVGFSRCGGYAWHEHALSGHTFACLLGVASLAMFGTRYRYAAATLALVGLIATWYLARVVGSALYGQGAEWGLDC